MKRNIKYDVIDMEESERRVSEFESCQYYKKNKDPNGLLYIIEGSWVQDWINYLNGKS